MTPLTVVLLLMVAFAVVLLFFVLFSTQNHQEKKHEEKKPAPPPPPKVYTTTGMLLQKIDERRRVMDEYHHTSVHDEYFELVFQLKNGEMLRLSCSKSAYRTMPFRKTGELTYRSGRLMQFKTTEQVISDEYY